MNLLAHALIAYATLPNTYGQECTGALMADFFTGEVMAEYPVGIRRGIRQHRAVDAFTDCHPVFRSCRAAIAVAGAPRHTAGILADIFWDHVLASEWERFGRPLCGLTLDEFCAALYERFRLTEGAHSPMFARAFRWIADGAWLATYATLDGVERTLAGLSERMSGDVDLAACAGILVDLDAYIREGFAAFWPDIVAFGTSWAELDGIAASGPVSR